MKRMLQWAGVILLPVIVIGGLHAMSRDVTVRNVQWPTQMQYSPASLSQTSNTALPLAMTEQSPPLGTIPRGFRPFHYGPGQAEAERAGRELSNPFQPTAEVLARGKYIFENNCAVCHGMTGAGDGPVVPKYPNPPSYRSDTSRALPDGTMFHIITLGRRNMPAHGAQVASDDRWKVICYIRKLQGKVNENAD